MNMTQTPFHLDDKPINISTEVNFIWSIANKLRPTYNDDNYKDVIIPMTIIRRLECALDPTKEDVLKKHKNEPNAIRQQLEKVAKQCFYNTSEFTLEKLCDDPDQLADNFKSYINAFSTNVKDILFSEEKGLGFDKQINKMDKNDRLYNVVKAFSELDLNPATIDNIKMGYIFEDLIRRFSENKKAGDHYTGRDIIKTMVQLLLAEGTDDVHKPNKVITIADYACGTGGMLSTSYNYIKSLNETATIHLFGQEINPESYAICVAEMLIKGQQPDSIRYQDTLKKDSFSDKKMHFIIENPPFGTAWGGKNAPNSLEKAVLDEHKKGTDGRFPAGLPKTSDMQMLFLQAAIQKLDDQHGRAAIIESSSPLTVGDTTSGESQIRRYLIDNDFIEAIIALPSDLFYNTEIASYIWILSKNKRMERKGKIQLINATTFCKKLDKFLGCKKNELTANYRDKITNLYVEFKENEYSKICDKGEFLYNEFTILHPLQRSYAMTNDRIQNVINTGILNELYDQDVVYLLQKKEKLSKKEEAQLESFIKNENRHNDILNTLKQSDDQTLYMSRVQFLPAFKKVTKSLQLSAKLEEKLIDALSKVDKNATIVRDKHENIVYDDQIKDIACVSLNEDINEYMKREIHPHSPYAIPKKDATTQHTITKVGASIPFSKYFYTQKPLPNRDELKTTIKALEASIQARFTNLFKEDTL